MMTSIKTLESIKNKLSSDEYNSLADDLVILAKIWYAVSKEDDNYFYIDKARDTGEIAKFFKTKFKTKTVKTKRRTPMQCIFRTSFKTTEEKLQDNGWKIIENRYLPHSDCCEKKINGKNIMLTYDTNNNQLDMAQAINFTNFDDIISICQELKKLED